MFAERIMSVIPNRHEWVLLPIGSWHFYFNDPTVADALLDRLLTNAHRLELKGESLRKTCQKLTDREHSK